MKHIPMIFLLYDQDISLSNHPHAKHHEIHETHLPKSLGEIYHASKVIVS